jgi:hypothetical protein
MSTGSDRPYKVEFLRSTMTRIRQCSREVVRLGIGREYARTLKTILHKLSTTPSTWGDPLRHFKSAELLVYRRVLDRILVEYGVHDAQRIVFVKDCRPVLGHPLQSSG